VLIIDSREYGPLKKRALAAIPDSQVEFLHAGDYLLFDQDGHSIGIERKEIKDLLGSLAQNKLKRQLDSLRQYDRGILLIEGHWLVLKDGTLCVHNKRSAWQPASIQAILLALQEQTGAKVLHTANYDETLITLRMLDKRGERGCFWPKEKTNVQDHRAA
jgi:ERCC4-type nuclease